VTGVAIVSLLQTISKLNLGPKVNIDKFNLILHQCMLTVLVLVIFTATIPYRVLPGLYFKFEVALVYADLVNQLMVCYICWTMGSSVKLRQYNCTYVRTADGRVSLKFRLREPQFTQSIGDLSEDEELEEHPDITSRKRGMSLDNERGCDQIMQQFISGLEEY
jgi:hypothetical protein